MKRNKIFGFLAGALLMAPAATFAQQALRSGYFLEGYEYRHVMNPAFGPDRKGFVSFPFLGNINVGMSGNMGVSNFLYKTPDGGLTTFLNESVTASDFLGGINQNNRLAIDYNWSIFSMGFSKFGGYNTIGINLRTNVSATLPYELFEFMKVGGKGDNTVYHMENIGVSSKAYVELALGHSRDINEQWRVGGKLKFLLGGLNASAMIDRMDVEMTDEQWKVQGSGSLDLAMKGRRCLRTKRARIRATMRPTRHRISTTPTLNWSLRDWAVSVWPLTWAPLISCVRICSCLLLCLTWALFPGTATHME